MLGALLTNQVQSDPCKEFILLEDTGFLLFENSDQILIEDPICGVIPDIEIPTVEAGGPMHARGDTFGALDIKFGDLDKYDEDEELCLLLMRSKL